MSPPTRLHLRVHRCGHSGTEVVLRDSWRGPPAGPAPKPLQCPQAGTHQPLGCSSQLPLLQPGDTAARSVSAAGQGFHSEGQPPSGNPALECRLLVPKPGGQPWAQGPARASLHPSGLGAPPFTPAQELARVRRPCSCPTVSSPPQDCDLPESAEAPGLGVWSPVPPATLTSC